jgi:hypothetical protein
MGLLKQVTYAQNETTPTMWFDSTSYATKERAAILTRLARSQDKIIK